MGDYSRYKNKLETNYDIKIFTDNIEYECLQQTEQLLQTDTFNKSKVRLMPDTHAGKGAVIGFTCPLGTRIVPNIVRSRYRLWYVMCYFREYRH